MRFELVELMVTKGSKYIREGKYLAIRDNEEVRDYKNGFYDLEDFQPYGILYEEIDDEDLSFLIRKAEEENDVGYLCDNEDIIVWECMSDIECHEIEK